MSTHYQHVTKEERHVFSAYLRDGLSLRDIQRKLGRSLSTWSYEVNVNGNGRNSYDPESAHFRASLRKWNANSQNPCKSDELWIYVINKLKERWSPRQISGRLREEFPENGKMRVSHETIYAFINSEEGMELGLFRCLRRRRLRKERRIRLKNVNPGATRIPDRISISLRPKTAGKRNRYGDWESDIMEGRKTTGAMLSVQKERRSQFVCLLKTKDKTSAETVKAHVENLGWLPMPMLRTITYDNGTENSEHVQISRILGIAGYFCDAYSSWQKGSVENIIGLVRDYLPKGTDLNAISGRYIRTIQNSLNNRPRECLGFKTPNEVLSNHLKPLGVRLPA